MSTELLAFRVDEVFAPYEVSTIADSKITSDHVGYPTVNPASNGRARDLQVGE